MKSIVWSHKTNLPIRIHAKHSTGRHTIEYVATIAGLGGQPEYVDERLRISDYLSVTRNLDVAKFKLDSKFLERIDSHIPEIIRDRISSTWTSDIRQTKSVLPLMQRALSSLMPASHHSVKKRVSGPLHIWSIIVPMRLAFFVGTQNQRIGYFSFRP